MGTTTVDIEDIKWLRDETGAGIMEARKALQDADGDRDKAKKLVQQKAGAHAAKLAGRHTAEGIVEPYVHAGGQIGVLVELNSETDFVAVMPEFKKLAHEIALQVCANAPRYVSVDEIPESEVKELKAQFLKEATDEGKPERIAPNIAEGKFKKYAQGLALLEQPWNRDPSKTIDQLVQELSARTRENIVVKRFCRFQVGV
jgi:elongation factor Ts